MSIKYCKSENEFHFLTMESQSRLLSEGLGVVIPLLGGDKGVGLKKIFTFLV